MESWCSMKILYGVQGTGNGHITRSRVMVRALRQHRHEVDIMVSGRPGLEFAPNDDLQTEIILPGITFVSEKGKINYFKTLTTQKPLSFIRNIMDYDLTDYDLVITDYEPISMRLAKLQGVPSIGIGHQYAFNYNIPKAGGNILTNMIMKTFAPADIEIGLHWHPFGAPICPPIIPEFSAPNHVIDKKIIVYLPFEEMDDISSFFSSFPSHDFYIYHHVQHPIDDKNLHFRPFSKTGFHQDLIESNGVICNAGFELPSEALSLGKKLLVKPLHGQLEQVSNAVALQELNIGSSMKGFDQDRVSNWLLEESGEKIQFGPVAHIIADWISLKKWTNVESLSKTAWTYSSIPSN